MYTDMKITKTYKLWEWSEIDAITYEKVPNQKGKILLYFTKGDVTKRFFFDENDQDRVFEVAKSHNKKIKIYDAYEYKQNLKRFKESMKKSKKRNSKLNFWETSSEKSLFLLFEIIKED